MLVSIVTLTIKPDQRQSFLAAIEDNALCTVRDEPGCHRFEAFQDVADPDTYRLVEVFEDEAAVAAHRETAHYERWREATQVFLASPLIVTQTRDVTPLTLPS